MAMGYNEEIKLCKIAAFIILLINIYSCKSYSYRLEVDSYLNTPITKESLKLNLYKNEDIINATVNVIRIDSIYIKTIIDSVMNIKDVYLYNDSLNLLSYSSYGIYNSSMVDIGKKYYLNGAGSIVRIIDTDQGYKVYWKQAISIGDTYTIKKKADHTKTWLEKSTYHGEKVWRYSFINKRKKMKEIIIDGNTGKILREISVELEY